ncbi:MAG TPA: BON domain-containing protein [Solirubrobacteraceae bacterium]|nr:BON domain-containing protein [Solirubrobacteraceae bacterium]
MKILQRQPPLQRHGRRKLPGVVLFAAGAATARLAGYLDKRRRHIARDRAAAAARDLAQAADRKARYTAGVVTGALQETATPLRGRQREYDDVTLARKVESELFRPADAPKESVSINVHNGIVELRGEVKRPEDIKELEAATQKIEGVKNVHNLLHTPGSPPKHSPAGQSR